MNYINTLSLRTDHELLLNAINLNKIALIAPIIRMLLILFKIKDKLSGKSKCCVIKLNKIKKVRIFKRVLKKESSMETIAYFSEKGVLFK